MEELIEAIFSNVFMVGIIVSVIWGAVKSAQLKAEKTDETKESLARTEVVVPKKQNTWLEVFAEEFVDWEADEKKKPVLASQPEQTVKTVPKVVVPRKESADFVNGQTRQVKPAAATFQSGLVLEEETTALEINQEDLAWSVVMAEVLGPPRAKRQTIR